MGHLEKRIEAEEQRDALAEKLAQAEARLRGVLNSEPESATRAMMWMGRTEQAEKLLMELSNWLAHNASVEELLPPGFAMRVRAQLDSVESLRKAQIGLGERPPDDEWWETFMFNGKTVRATPDPGIYSDDENIRAAVSEAINSMSPPRVPLQNDAFPQGFLRGIGPDPYAKMEEVSKIRVADYVPVPHGADGSLTFRGVPVRADRWAEIGQTTLADGREGVEMARLGQDADGYPVIDVRRGLGLPSP